MYIASQQEINFYGYMHVDQGWKLDKQWCIFSCYMKITKPLQELNVEISQLLHKHDLSDNFTW